MNYKHDIAEEGGFRCQRGDHIRPLYQLRMQDGIPVCTDHRDSLSHIEADQELARSLQHGAVDSLPPRKWPAPAFSNEFAGAPGITGTTPLPVTVSRGDSGVIVLTGTNFADDDVITSTVPGAALLLVFSPTSIAIGIPVSIITPVGFYDVTYNNVVFRQAVRVI